MSEHKDLLAAFLAVQHHLPRIQKDKINPAFRAKYVSLDALTEAVTPVLIANALIWSTFPCRDEHGDPALSYQLVHVPTGEKLEGTMPLMLAKNDPQGLGSALTYARRQSLTAVLNITTGEDDDGNQASRRQQNGGQQKVATKDDVAALVAAAKGLKVGQIRMAFTACGLDASNDVTQAFRSVPQVKAAELAQMLAGVEREQ